MLREYNLIYKLITYILLISLFLQSCNNFSSSLLARPKEEKLTNATLTLPNPISMKQLAEKEFTLEGGHVIKFYQEKGQLQADLTINAPIGFSKAYGGLSMYIAKDINLSLLARLNPMEQKRLIHAKLPSSREQGYVYISESGLKGGMRR